MEGFAAPVPADLPAEGPVSVTFRHSDAHAWGEVFFSDYGWVAFDPTPAAPAIPPQPPPVAGASQSAARATASTPESGPIGRAWDAFINWNGQEQRAMYRRWGDGLRTGLSGNGGEGGGGWLGALLAWAGAIMLVLWLMQAFLRRGRRRAPRFGAGTARSQAALAFYNDLLQVLSRRGFVRKPCQTPREFAEHVVRHGGDAFKAVLVVTDVFESVRYGGMEITQEEFNRLQTALDRLRELTFVSAQ
jgi:hypothetical protein